MFKNIVVVPDVPYVGIPNEPSCIGYLYSPGGVTHEQNSELETFPGDKCDEERFRGRGFCARKGLGGTQEASNFIWIHNETLPRIDPTRKSDSCAEETSR
jgi:hypothetical protein